MNIFLLGLISFFTDVSSEMVYPLIPLFLTSSLGASPAVIGLIEGTVESLASLLRVVSGHYSDRLGKRKPLAVSGYVFSLGGKSVLALAGSWPGVFLARALDRMGKGVRSAPRDALIAESAAPGKLGAAFGFHRLMDTLGAAVGVVLAYFLLRTAPAEYSRIFLWSLLPAGLAVLCFIPVKDVLMAKSTALKKALPPLAQLPPSVKTFYAVSLVFALGNSSNHFLLLRAYNIGFVPTSVVLLYLVYNLSYAAVSYGAGRLSDKVGRKPLLLGAYLLYAFVYAGFALVASQYTVWLLFAIYGLYAGIAEGVEKALLMDIGSEYGKATILGWHGTIVGMSLLPASLLAGLLWKYISPSAPFAFGAIMALAASALLYRLIEPRRAGMGS